MGLAEQLRNYAAVAMDADGDLIFAPVPEHPLVARCQCGRRISDHRYMCKACALVALKEAKNA